MEALATVAVLTGSFPYSYAGEDSFLSPELPWLSRELGRVIMVPALRSGARADLPAGIEVDDSLATALAARPGALRTLRDALAFPPARSDLWRRLPVVGSPAALRRLLAFAATATRVARWYEHFAERHNLDPRRTVLYTYWLDALAAGLLLARVQEPSLVVVSRGHRVDLYEEHQRPPYLPCRKWLIDHLDGIFLVSDEARSYLLRRQPEAMARLVTSHLGTPEPGFLASPSTDGVLRVVSCSGFLPVKRVDLLARGLIVAARQRPDRPLEWHHFGDGPLRAEVQRLLAESAPASLSWALNGRLANAAVLERYRTQPIDLFANASEVEGIPVSIMEAQSCGIPAMAPAVGGVPEIVSSDNGFLLPTPTTPATIGNTVCSLLDAPFLLDRRRKRSRQAWEDKFRAESNFAAFARELAGIRRGRGEMRP